jgi:hypothetical protein
LHGVKGSTGQRLPHVYYADKTLTNIRLARLEHRMGNVDATEAFQKEALSNCEKTKWGTYCKPACLISVSEYLDRSHFGGDGHEESLESILSRCVQQD